MTRKSSLTSRRTQSHRVPEDTNSRAARQARRLNRQQKRLEQEMGVGVAMEPTAARGRMVKYSDIKQVEPLTSTQEDFFDAWEDDQATGYVLFGAAGTGKSWCALYHALCDVLDPNKPDYQKIVIIRAATPTRQLGHMPGNLAEKIEVYEMPYHTIFSDITGNKDAYAKMKEVGKVEFLSSSYMRGTTLDNSIIIFDEFQGANFHEISTIATRLGKKSKIIFCGDGRQDDLIYNKNDTSGFKTFMDVMRMMPSFRSFKFTEDDIVRSGFVKEFLLACNRLGV